MMSRIIRVIIQNSSYQNINREKVKNREIREIPDLSIVNLLFVFVMGKLKHLIPPAGGGGGLCPPTRDVLPRPVAGGCSDGGVECGGGVSAHPRWAVGVEDSGGVGCCFAACVVVSQQ